MTWRIDVSVGPVQGFVAQSRRTRDLWGSSYLLSFLSAHAMRSAEVAGGRIIRPSVNQDQLYHWVTGSHEGTAPRIGTLPNHFVVEVDGGDASQVAGAAVTALEVAWNGVCTAVWDRFVQHASPVGRETHRIWIRQIFRFWEVAWTAGPPEAGSALLARRKHWRSHRLPDEPGDKCMMMHDLQELSGYVRSEGRESRKNSDRFWNLVRKGLGRLDLGDNERLCAIALVKRLFPRVSLEALGWSVDTSHWPSTVYMAAVPWIRRVTSQAPRLAGAYSEAVLQTVSADVLAERHLPFRGLGGPGAGSFPKLDANLFHCDRVKDERLCPVATTAGHEAREIMVRLLRQIYDVKDTEGDRIGSPSPFFALILADGDRIGKLVSNLGGQSVGCALSKFTGNVSEIVQKHDGVTVYTGGDDVLAILPVPQALRCADALSSAYQLAFANKPSATLSATVVFAHVRQSLAYVIATAHRLLDEVAKDGNGRNSLAAAVLKRGGLSSLWATTWNRRSPDGCPISAVELLESLAQALRAGVSEPGISSALIYRLREMLASLCGWDRWEPGAWNALATDLDIRAFVRAEILQSLALRLNGDAEARADELADLIWKLLGRSRALESGESHQTSEVGVDALVLSRFLAAPAQGEADE